MLASGYNVTESDVSPNILLAFTSTDAYLQNGLVVQRGDLDLVKVSAFELNFDEILNSTSGIYPLAGSYLSRIVAAWY
jgi:hypothetical protein